jgi:hypothetical protein
MNICFTTRRRLLGGALALSLTSGLALGQTVSTAATAQISGVLSAKSQFTAAQKKIDSNLVFAAMAARGQLAGSSFAAAVPAVPTDAAGLVTVDIKGTAATIAARVTALGGQVVSQVPQFNFVRAKLPLQSLEALAASPAVNFIGPQQTGHTNVGSLTSQGYIAHSARDVVVGLGYNGSGVKVGVLSDSATPARVAALIASGDLGPNTTVLAGQAGAAGDEGAAMMENIQDLAPGAQLFFATADGSEAQFAANILALAAAGCTIIVDDVTYFDEGVFQDGVVAQAVNTFTAGGGLYFSSAANSGNLSNGTSGTWEGDFVDGGAVGGPIATGGETGRVHNFGTALFDTLTSVGGSAVSLKWSDPLGASSNDYDLFVLNSTGTTVKAFSATVQTGTQDPFEFIIVNCSGGYCPAIGDQIVIVKFAGSARALHLGTERGTLSIATSGATYGHNAGLNTVSTAATYWDSAKTGTKPFTGPANPTETFSSDGPRKIFYNPNGTAITAGNFLFGTNGGTTLQKPDLTAADGTASKTPGFYPFFGTSDAAPHAAAVAALVKSARPTYTNAQIKTAMTATALDTDAPGVDRDAGAGIVMALAAVQYALAH